MLGGLYLAGEPVFKDGSEAVATLRPLSDTGDAMAQYYLGAIYYYGKGVPKDVPAAMEWWRKAAGLGNKNAMLLLAEIYFNGDGVKQSDVETRKWLRRAAELNEPSAQYNLGALYGEGRGGKVDFPEAYKWFSLAANARFENAAKARDGLVPLMSEAQLAEGKRRLMAFTLGVPLADTGSGRKRLTVALLPFEDQTGDPAQSHWRYTVPGLLGVLSDVKSLKILPEAAANFGLRQVKIKTGEAINADQARKIGELIEAQRVVSGNFQFKTGTWILKAQILNVATGETLPEISATSTNIIAARDALNLEILQAFGKKPTGPELRKMTKRSGESPVALAWMSRAYATYEQKSKWSEGEAYIRQAIALEPRSAYYQLALAASLGSQGNLEQAEQAIRQAMKLDRDNATAHLNLGIIQLMQGKPRDGETEIKASLHLDATEEESFERLGEIYGSQDKLEEALFLYHEAERLNPYSASVSTHLAITYAKQGDRAKTLAQVQAAERLDAEDPTTMQLTCDALEMIKEIPAAVEHFDKFIAFAKASGLNPRAIQLYSERAQELKIRLTPTPVKATLPKQYSPAELKTALQQKLTPEELALVPDSMASTPEMDRWAQELTRGATNETGKAHQLFDSLSRRLVPGEGGARTASETYAVWNQPAVALRCQEYARLYVALARAAGLSAYFVIVNKDNEGNTITHACAGVFMEGKAWLIDPSIVWFGAPHQGFAFQDDLQAIALYLGQQKDLARLRLAVKLLPDSLINQYNLACKLIEAGLLKETSDVIEQMKQLGAEENRIQTIQGLLALHAKNYAAAADSLAKAVKNTTQKGDVYYALAIAHYELGELKQAREEFREAVRNGLKPEETSTALQAIIRINEKVGMD